MGIHGAALVHGIFARRGSILLELKTLYGYGSSLFALVADSRAGTHVHVDVRDYFITGGHKPIDDSLITRVLNGLEVALETQKETKQLEKRGGKIGDSEIAGTMKATNWKGDFVTGPIVVVDELNHPLGPKISQQSALCKSTIMQKYRELIKNDDTHCDPCAT
jgi:hypothetical protein